MDDEEFDVEEFEDDVESLQMIPIANQPQITYKEDDLDSMWHNETDPIKKAIIAARKISKQYE